MSESTICTSISLYFQYRNVTSVLIVSVRSDLPFKAQKKRCDLHPFSSITRERVPFFGLPDLLYLSPTDQFHPFPSLSVSISMFALLRSAIGGNLLHHPAIMIPDELFSSPIKYRRHRCLNSFSPASFLSSRQTSYFLPAKHSSRSCVISVFL